MSSNKWLLMETCGVLVAAQAHEVVEVWGGGRCYPIPGVPAHVLGLCDWTGSPLVVIDLATALQLPGRQELTDEARQSLGRAEGRVPILRAGTLMVGAMVDRVMGIRDISPSEQHEPALFKGTPMEPYACAQHDGPHGLVALVDFQSLLENTKVRT